MPVAVRSGDDPRQTQGIEKRNGGHALSLRAEGILHSAEQQRGILRRVARFIKQHAAHIAAHRALREILSGAAGGKAADRAMVAQQINLALKSLTPREEKVIRLRFGLDDGRPRTLEEVGRDFGVTRERVRQIEAKAIRKLHSRKCLSLLNGLIE